MPSVAEVARRYGAAYLAKFGSAAPAEHRKVLALWPAAGLANWVRSCIAVRSGAASTA